MTLLRNVHREHRESLSWYIKYMYIIFSGIYSSSDSRDLLFLMALSDKCTEKQ